MEFPNGEPATFRLTLDWDREEDVEQFFPTVRGEEALEGQQTLGAFGQRDAGDVWERWHSSNHGRIPEGKDEVQNGEHYIEWDAASSVAELENLRRQYGDDGLRMAMDGRRWRAGSPFYQTLWNMKGIPVGDWPPHAVEAVAERVETHGFAPEASETKEGQVVNWEKVSQLAADHAGGSAALGNLFQERRRNKWSTAPRKVVYNWVHGRNEPDPTAKAQLRRYAKKHNLGHYREEGAVDAESPPYDTTLRRQYSEGLSVPWLEGLTKSGEGWDSEGDDEESEHRPLEVRTGYFGTPDEEGPENVPDQTTIKQYHAAVMSHLTEILAPGPIEDITRARQRYEEKPMHREEAARYVRNVHEVADTTLPPVALGRTVLVHVILWDEDMADPLWNLLLAIDHTSTDPAEVASNRDTDAVHVLLDDPPAGKGSRWW